MFWFFFLCRSHHSCCFLCVVVKNSLPGRGKRKNTLLKRRKSFFLLPPAHDAHFQAIQFGEWHQFSHKDARQRPPECIGLDVHIEFASEFPTEGWCALPEWTPSSSPGGSSDTAHQYDHSERKYVFTSAQARLSAHAPSCTVRAVAPIVTPRFECSQRKGWWWWPSSSVEPVLSLREDPALHRLLREHSVRSVARAHGPSSTQHITSQRYLLGNGCFQIGQHACDQPQTARWFVQTKEKVIRHFAGTLDHVESDRSCLKCPLSKR